MLKAIVPMPTATRRRTAWPPWLKVSHDSRKVGCCTLPEVRDGLRFSCFHIAAMFSTIVATAAPWMTWISLAGVKSASKVPNSSELTIMPISSITYISPTTLGCDSTGARSVARASPTVCVMCSPAPTSRKASPAPSWPNQAGYWCELPPPDSTSKANGIIASPPNCSIVPFQR